MSKEVIWKNNRNLNRNTKLVKRHEAVTVEENDKDDRAIDEHLPWVTRWLGH